MKNLLLLHAHLLTTLARLLRPGGAKAIVADSLLMKQQLIVINRSRRRAPNLTPVDRILFGFWSLFLNPHRIPRAAVIIRPSTLLKFHDLNPGRFIVRLSREFEPLTKPITKEPRTWRGSLVIWRARRDYSGYALAPSGPPACGRFSALPAVACRTPDRLIRSQTTQLYLIY
jgi:hypothetical protein